MVARKDSRHSSEGGGPREQQAKGACVRGLPRETVTRVHMWLADRISSDVRVRDMAAFACVSEFHFYRRFRLATGESPYAFLTRLRIAQAQRLLHHTDMPLREVSRAVGYRPAPFCVVFRRHCGMTPMSYRRKCRGDPRNAHPLYPFPASTAPAA